MNDVKLDTLLVAATNRRSDDTNNFVKTTMQKIKVVHTISTLDYQPHRLNWWYKFTQLKPAPRIAVAIVTVAAASLIAFTGYAYAIGSDPISLIKRWVVGNTVNVQYNGRKFEYGKKLNYSDAAITAYAELNTVRSLDFRAEGTLGANSKDVEYVSDVLSKRYIYPTIGTIDSVDGDQVTMTQQYLLGDKMNPSHDISEQINAKPQNVQYYQNGNPAPLTPNQKGQLVAIFTSKSIAHNLKTNAIAEVTTYFTFALSHPLQDFKEADQKSTDHGDQAQTPLYEPNWGGIAVNMCLNNPLDTCSGSDKFDHDQGEGLYTGDPAYIGGRANDGLMNPHTVQWGEGAATPQDQPADLLDRTIQGAIVNMDSTYITIKTSSGSLWKLNFTSQQQARFAHAYSPLKIGDQIIGMVLQSVYDLNSRTVDDAHIMSLVRL